MLEIFEPRYRDRSVLIACYHIVEGRDLEIEITKGAYAGFYRVPAEVIKSSPIEKMETKSGRLMNIKAVPLDELIKTREKYC